MKTFALTLIAALGLTSTAFAGEVALKAPLQAGVLHDGTLDMVAYRTDLTDGAYEVTAVFRARDTLEEPRRVTMRLENGDRVGFSMPSAPGTLYTFAREGGAVTIAAEPVRVKLAAK